MKRFLVFAGDTYYPNGGWEDFKSSFNTIIEARAVIKVLKTDWAEIVDRNESEILERYRHGKLFNDDSQAKTTKAPKPKKR